uniref:Uncharacterized protein n=1 Tax=Setaria italica TaxID=4555 RepID=K3ZZ30_SETIT
MASDMLLEHSGVYAWQVCILLFSGLSKRVWFLPCVVRQG